MKTLKYIIVCFFIFCFTGCIDNDIPYPSLIADITTFEVRGQISSTIDTKTRTVVVELADSIDLSNVRLLKFEVSNDAKIKPVPESTIDLRNPITFTLTTYQDYLWTVSAKQIIERYVNVENQMGEAVIDEHNKTILVNVIASQDLSKIKILKIKLGAKGATISPDPYSVTDFTVPRKFVSSLNGKDEVWTISVKKSEVSIVTKDANPFAKYALFYGECPNDSQNLSFKYRKKGEENWTTVPSENITVEATKFSAKVTDLLPDTDYEYAALLGEQTGEIKSFRTEKDTQVKNLSFDDWCQEGKTWFPNIDLSAENYVWDSGNKGASSFGKNPTMAEESDVIKGKAAKLASSKVLIAFAAGNIYTGKYVETVGAGALLDFGIPFTSRPVSLKGYYKYTPGIIDNAMGDYANMKGKSDICHIYIVLADWETPFRVNSNKKEFLNLDNDPGIIAVSRIEDSEGTNGKYKEFELKLEYKSLDRKPTHILIVAAASKYGDYFTGSTSSVLYLDEFELIY